MVFCAIPHFCCLFFLPFLFHLTVISSGTDNESAGDHANESILEQNEDAETEDDDDDDDEASDADQMHELDGDGQSAAAAASASMRFYILYMSLIKIISRVCAKF